VWTPLAFITRALYILRATTHSRRGVACCCCIQVDGRCLVGNTMNMIFQPLNAFLDMRELHPVDDIIIPGQMIEAFLANLGVRHDNHEDLKPPCQNG